MENNLKLYICGANEIDTHKAKGITHIIRIVNAGIGDLQPSWFKGEYLQLCFGDVISEADAANYKTKSPNKDDLKKALDFSRLVFRNPDSSMLISCDYGASRSPAIALVILADHLGIGNEKEALKRILEIRPDAVPNNYVVELGDTLLNRNGALRSSLDALYSEINNLCDFLTK